MQFQMTVNVVLFPFLVSDNTALHHEPA